ncbi:MAG: efflux RND transporter periplasmic adaptor subunit [Planctomycetes bacterium]|nr:efflux RND transporter periplasmic adaptor subunit [Planctomycetota bacterium]
MKKVVVVLVFLILAGGGAYYCWMYYRGDARADVPAPVTAKVERGGIRLTVASTGRIVSNLDVDIKCKASGQITKLPFDVSDTVRQGDLLVELDPIDEQRVLRRAEVDLQAAQAKLQIARENLSVAERTLATDRQRTDAALKAAEVRAADARAKADRMKQLLAKHLCSQEESDTAETAAIQADADLATVRVRVEELKTQELALELKRQDVRLAESQAASAEIALEIAQDRLRDTKVSAPIDGVVAARNVQIGQIIASGVSNVGGGTTVLTLSDLSHVFVLASVDESDIGKVRLGQPAAVTADAFRGRTFQGRVVRVATRGVNLSNVVTFEVKIEVTGEEKSLLRPEMTANVEVLAAEKENVLLVPAEAVVRKAGGQHFVTVMGDGGAAAETAVQVGISDVARTEITQGLAGGETVLVFKTGSDGRWGAGQRPAGPPRGLLLPTPPRR